MLYQHQVSLAATTTPVSLPQPSLLGHKASDTFNMMHTVAQKLHIKSSPTSSGFEEPIRIVLPLLSS